MTYNFTDENFDEKKLLKNEISGINQYLLDNNTKQITQIYNFLKDKSTQLFLVQGFLGVGKSQIIKHSLQTLNSETIVMKYTCFETSILDDMLLSLFEEFKKLTALGKIEPPKIKADNFTQKINNYFQAINKPILIVIKSFEEILNVNIAGFISFISHLCKYPNIKIIISGRTMNSIDFGIKFAKINILALEKSLFEKYLRSENCKLIGPVSDELYKNTRGYYFYVTLSLKIMQLKQLTLIQFIDAFSKSLLTFNDFILREVLSLIDPISGHLIRFLTIIRHPVSVKLLKKLQLWNEEKVLFFINNLLLTGENESIYLRNCYKTISENSIHPNIAIKIHKACIELYNTQLPLKPLERDLIISRQTMRNEIEYHATFIPKEVIVTETEVSTNEQETPKQEEIIEAQITEENSIKEVEKIKFEFDDSQVINTIANSINDFLEYKNQILTSEKEDSLTLIELINLAKEKENKFDYKYANLLYIKALMHKNEDEYYTFLPTIYSKLAFNYQKLLDWFNALKYFELLKEFYMSTNNTEQFNNTRYNIANIYFVMFKNAQAKELLSQIEKENISDELRIKVLCLSANLANNNETAYNYYKHALELNCTNIDKNLLSELYYKFALCNEEKGNYKTSLTYYQKCIELNLKDNKYLSNCLSNIASLYDDIGQKDLAIKYYNKSIIADTSNNNNIGLFNSYMKLAEIYPNNDSANIIKNYQNALKTAVILNDNFCIASAAAELGDFYFNNNHIQSALKYYKLAWENIKNSDGENIKKVLSRINDIKLKIGEEKFNEIK